MSNDVVNLPEEIIADILSRLPVKSLCRFKCVSPSWLSLISDPKFAQAHLNRTTTTNNNHHPNHQILIVSDKYQTLHSVNFSTTHVPVATKLDFPLSEHDHKELGVVGSCNGLVLVVTREDTKFLFNPSTRMRKELPKPPFGLYGFSGVNKYGFGYDYSHDDYKVLMLSYSTSTKSKTDTIIVSIYSLKTDSWKRVEDIHYAPDYGKLSGVYLNGCLHWLRYYKNNSEVYSPVIVVFDLGNESFRKMPLPSCLSLKAPFPLAVIGGCLCIYCRRDSAQTDVWMMEEYGVMESWTAKFTIDKSDGQSIMKLLCLLGNGEILSAMNGKELVLYNPKERTSRDIVVCGIPTEFSDVATYVESLVSPNCYNGIGGPSQV